MCASVLHHTTHAYGRRALEQSLSDNGIGPGNGLAAAGNGKDAVMDTLHDLADARLDTSLVSEVGNVLARLANDDSSLLGRDDGAKGQLRLGILLVGLGSRLAIRTQPGFVVQLEVVNRVEHVAAAVRGQRVLSRRHICDGLSEESARW